MSAWTCPRCGVLPPGALPFHGSDGHLHCPQLDCDEPVKANIDPYVPSKFNPDTSPPKKKRRKKS